MIGLAWRDDDLLVVSVPPGMDKAFDRTMEGVELEFEIISAEELLTPYKTMEPTR